MALSDASRTDLLHAVALLNEAHRKSTGALVSIRFQDSTIDARLEALLEELDSIAGVLKGEVNRRDLEVANIVKRW